MEELFKAYYACLELAKKNAFKCIVQIETHKGIDGDMFFTVWVKNFVEDFTFEKYVPFYLFLSSEFDSKIEKVKQLIQEASC